MGELFSTELRDLFTETMNSNVTKNLNSSIGFAIAKKLANEGAKVVISSRKENNVSSAADKLRNSGFQNVLGLVCHVGKAEDRSRLISEVKLSAHRSLCGNIEIVLFLADCKIIRRN